MIAFSVVDLPAPFGPISPTISLSATSSSTRAPPAPTRSATSRFSSSSAGLSHSARRGPPSRRDTPDDIQVAPDLLRRPSASVRPWSSTWIRSQISITRAMLWSISSTPARAPPATERTTSRTPVPPPRKAGRRLVESTNAGSVASARATPSLRSSPCASAAAGSSATPTSPSSPSSRLHAAVRPAGPRPHRAPPPRRSRAPTAPERAAVLERAREAGAARRCGLQAVTLAAPELHRPLVGTVETAEHVHECRLAGAVRADQPDNLVAVQLQRDFTRGPGPPRRPRDGGGPESASGPPLAGASPARAVWGIATHSDLRNDLRP